MATSPFLSGNCNGKRSIQPAPKTMRWIGVGSLVLSLFACSSSPSTGGFGEGSEQSSGGNGSNGAGASGSGGASSGASGSGGASASGIGGLSSSGGSNASSGSNGSGGSSSGASSGSSSGGLTTGDAGLQNNPDIDYTLAPVTLTMGKRARPQTARSRCVRVGG